MKRIIFFDGVCSLCNGFVDFVLRHNSRQSFLFCSLQSEAAKKELPEQHLGLDTIVLKDQGQVYTRSTAVLRIVFAFGGWWSLFAIVASILPVFIRDFIYQIIATNRYRLFGKKETCRIPTATEKSFFLE